MTGENHTHYAIVRTGRLVHHEGWCKTPEAADRAFDYAILGTEVLVYTREEWLKTLENEVRRLKGEPELVLEDVEKMSRELATQAIMDFCEQRKKDAQSRG